MSVNTNNPTTLVRSAGALRRHVPRRDPLDGRTLAALTPEERARLAETLARVSECIYHPEFRRTAFERRVLGPAPGREAGAELPFAEFERETMRRVLTRTVRLSHAQEQFLFLRFNYCRYRAQRLLRSKSGLTAAVVRELLGWEREAQRTRDLLVYCNRPLVISMADRSRMFHVEMRDLVAEGSVALLRAVDRFDTLRGFRFSTYACRAIIAAFARVARLASRRRELVPIEYDPTERNPFVTAVAEPERDDSAEELSELSRVLNTNLAGLTAREATVLRARFGLEEPKGAPASQSLSEVSRLIGLSRERVRQIQNTGIDKLRRALAERLGIELPLTPPETAAG
jgi:RNA polymerase sigma factor (sigma-70 family)